MWPKATNVLEFYYHWRRKRGGGGGGAGWMQGGMCPPFLIGGSNGMFVPPTFNPTFLFST